MSGRPEGARAFTGGRPEVASRGLVAKLAYNRSWPDWTLRTGSVVEQGRRG